MFGAGQTGFPPPENGFFLPENRIFPARKI
jgi:hypothetical protein